mmetsp:Transcript_24358/g.50585  ORF Transcript_24358/g.50585 Transcript_24358/m.50585 type:complete len:620 (+) Transcript_24358:193-2052(+)
MFASHPLSTPTPPHKKKYPETSIRNNRNEIQIGGGSEPFELRISIDSCRHLSQLLLMPTSERQASHEKCWLSFRFFGKVIQSDIFSVSDRQHSTQYHGDFSPTMDVFLIRSSYCDLRKYFENAKNSTLRIHVCKEGAVLGTAFIDWLALFADNYNVSERRNGLERRILRNDYLVESKLNSGHGNNSGGNSPPSIAVCVSLESENRFFGNDNHVSNEIHGQNEQYQSCNSNSSASCQQSSSEQIESRMNFADVDRAAIPINRQTQTEADAINHENDHRSKLIEEKKEILKLKEADLASKEKLLMESLSTLEMKQLEWEQWRRQEEINWHEKLRENEAATRKSIEENMCKVEKERLASLEKSHMEYEKLEARLQKSLLEVETKERHLKDVEANHQNERKRKLAELELREKLMKEEMKHIIEIEAAKTKAAMNQALAAEKAAAAAEKKVQKIESDMDQLREFYRKTPEVTLMGQVAELKGQLADSERRIESLKAEKAEIHLAKEQFRSNVHRLARALRRERDKLASKKANNDCERQQLHLTYDPDDKSFVMGGNQDEIQRILTDLNRISQSQDGPSVACGRSIPSSIDFRRDNEGPNHNQPPTQMSMPVRPVLNASTPSTAI